MTKHTKPTRVALDARSIFMPRPRGTGRNLWDAYKLIPKLRPDWEFTLYHQREAQAEFIGDSSEFAPNVTITRIDIPGDKLDLWLQVRVPWKAWTDHVDLIHYPANEAPVYSPVPYVATIHDLIPLKIKNSNSHSEITEFRKRVQRAALGAAHIITPSEATRLEIHQEFSIPFERITVIPWAPDQGVSARLRDTDAAEIGRIRQKYNLPDNWMVNFSGDTPRKNALGLVEAISKLSPTERSQTHAVLVGCEPESFRIKLEAFAAKLGVADNITFLGFAPHEDLPGLLKGASGMLMPSLCEGFGLPILDAFISNTPVLTSNCSSMPEVADDGAAYCNPTSPESIADGIRRLLDPAIAQRLRTAGTAQLKKYSWQRTAQRMCEVYEQALAQTKTCHAVSMTGVHR